MITTSAQSQPEKIDFSLEFFKAIREIHVRKNGWVKQSADDELTEAPIPLDVPADISNENLRLARESGFMPRIVLDDNEDGTNDV